MSTYPTHPTHDIAEQSHPDRFDRDHDLMVTCQVQNFLDGSTNGTPDLAMARAWADRLLDRDMAKRITDRLDIAIEQAGKALALACERTGDSVALQHGIARLGGKVGQ